MDTNFFAVPAMSLRTVVAAVPAAEVIASKERRCGWPVTDHCQSRTMVAVAQWDAALV